MCEPLGKEGINAAMNIIGRITGDQQTLDMLGGTIEIFRDQINELITALNLQFRISDSRLMVDVYRHIYMYGINIGIALYDRAVSEGIDVITLLHNLYDDEEGA